MSFYRTDAASSINKAANASNQPSKSSQRLPSGRPARAKMPARGKVLCVFSNPQQGNNIESAFSQRGYSLLRAKPGIHGYWLAITSHPDLIITDVPEPGPRTDSAYLLECLHRNPKTSDIPVIAMMSASQQSEAVYSGLQFARMCVSDNTPAEQLMERVDSLIDASSRTKRSTIMRSDSGHLHQVDAVFSELGAPTTAEQEISPLPLLGPVRMPATSVTPVSSVVPS